MNIQVEIQGITPLLCARFDEVGDDGSRPALQVAKRGTPRERAEKLLYRDERGCYFPGPNILAGMVSAGKFTKAGKMKLTTAKTSIVPAGVSVLEDCVKITPQEWSVDARSGVIPATGGRIMVYRPRFDSWKMAFTLVLDDTLFGAPIIRNVLDDLGSKVGIGAFRPEKRGPFGRFKVVKWKEES